MGLRRRGRYPAHSVSAFEITRFSRRSAAAERKFRGGATGGGGGIRTHGTRQRVQRFSRPSRSAAPAPLRSATAESPALNATLPKGPHPRKGTGTAYLHRHSSLRRGPPTAGGSHGGGLRRMSQPKAAGAPLAGRREVNARTPKVDPGAAFLFSPIVAQLTCNPGSEPVQAGAGQRRRGKPLPLLLSVAE